MGEENPVLTVAHSGGEVKKQKPVNGPSKSEWLHSKQKKWVNK